MLYLALDAYTESMNWSQHKLRDVWKFSTQTSYRWFCPQFSTRIRARCGTMSVYSIYMKATKASGDIENISRKTVNMHGL